MPIKFFKKRLHSLSHAVNGLKLTFWSDINFRIHLFSTTVALILSLVFEISLIEWALILFSIGMVLVAELFNTAIEDLIDLISPEYHQLAGKIKDVAAAAVLVTSVTALLVGLLIFGPYLFILIDKL